jgi:hypothetical protein
MFFGDRTQELHEPSPRPTFALNNTIQKKLNRSFKEPDNDLGHFLTPSSSPLSLESPTCQSVVNVSFIKIHRCGSGTFHNTLVNFAVKHNATVALGNCNYYEMFPNQLSSALLHPPPSNFNGYNMFFDHTIFNRTAAGQVLPADTAYITQIRHPFRHAFSAYTFMMRLQGSKVNYATLLKNPEKHEKLIRFGGPCKQVSQQLKINPSRNVMALELGYLNQSDTNLTRFRDYLQHLDREVTHVSILEELPQSLVLLKRKLCWSHQDILHLRLHGTGSRSTKNATLLAQQQRTHERWSSLDYALYEFFLARHRLEISGQPADFHAEVEEYHHVQRNFTEFCSTICEHLSVIPFDEAHVTDPLISQVRRVLAETKTFPRTRFYETFSVSYGDCVLHILDELESKKVLIYQMYGASCHGAGTRIPSLQCDTKRHVIPGLHVTAIKKLFVLKSCDRLKKTIS